MSYQLIKKWLDDKSSVTTEEINNAYDAMFQQPAGGPNICLVAALGAIKNSEEDYDPEPLVRDRIQKYEQEIEW